MNEKIQNVFIALLAIGVVLVGVTVYSQNKQLAVQEMKIDRLVDMATEQKEKTLINQQNIPTTQAAPQIQELVMTPDGGNDAGPSIVSGDFRAWLPLDWESRATTAGTWEVTNDRNKNVATISCPSAEAGYEAWDVTKSHRTYTHNNKTLYAGKWIGAPMRGSENLGWLATVWGGSPDRSAWGGTGCQIMFKVSTPPTRDELDRIETIYQMIR